MEHDVQDTLGRIEARLETIEKLAHQLKEEMAETSANVMASGQLSGADRKLDEILQILKAERKIVVFSLAAFSTATPLSILSAVRSPAKRGPALPR